MAFEYKRLTEIQRIGSSITTLFANPSEKITYIRCIILYNSHTAAVNVKLYNVPDSSGSVGSGTTANQFFGSNVGGETNINSGETLFLELPVPGIILEDVNDSIRGLASVNNVVTFQMYGGQE